MNNHRLMRTDLADPPSVPASSRAIPRPKPLDILHRFHSTDDRYEQTIVQTVLEMNREGTQWSARIGDPRREPDITSAPQHLSKHHWVPLSWVFDGTRGYWRDLESEEAERARQAVAWLENHPSLKDAEEAVESKRLSAIKGKAAPPPPAK